MKKIALMLTLLITGFSAQADVDPDSVLEVRTGGIENHGTVTSCQLLTTHPRIAKQLAAIQGMIDDAKDDPIVKTADHIKAQIPTYEIYAYIQGFAELEEVLLFRDYSDISQRVGPDAQALIKLANTLCP